LGSITALPARNGGSTFGHSYSSMPLRAGPAGLPPRRVCMLVEPPSTVIMTLSDVLAMASTQRSFSAVRTRTGV
jgi:hypothetical protein